MAKKYIGQCNDCKFFYPCVEHAKCTLLGYTFWKVDNYCGKRGHCIKDPNHKVCYGGFKQKTIEDEERIRHCNDWLDTVKGVADHLAKYSLTRVLHV